MLETATNYHAKYYSYALTRRGGEGVERLTQSLLNAVVDLNPHQVEAALFALHSPISTGVILADEVGLGKTIEAGLVLCQLWAERKRKLIIVCPASLRKQWQCELEEKFNLPAQIVDSKTRRDLAKEGYDNPYDKESVLIVSYPYAARTSDKLRAVSWDCVVMDEAHRLRNSYRESSKEGKPLRQAFEGRRKILLTATPIQNSLAELYGLSTMLDPTLFGDFANYRSNYMNAGGDLQDLRDRLKDFCWRTLRKDVRAFIKYTERIPLTHTFESSDREMRLYEEVSAYLQNPDTYAFPVQERSMLTTMVRKVLASSTIALIGTLERIRERLEGILQGLHKKDDSLLEEILSGDPDILAEFEEDQDDSDTHADEHEDQPPADSTDKVDEEKLRKEISLVEDLIHQAKCIGTDTKARELLKALKKGWDKLAELGAEQKVVIFTESRRTLNFLREFLEANGYDEQVVCFSGGSHNDAHSKEIYKAYKARHPEDTSSKDVMMRHALIDAFKRKGKILIATEAGAEGINLQFCSMLVNYDLPWNPQRIEQRIGRCHRYGQKFDVVVVNFCNARNAADVRVFEVLQDKFSLFSGLFGASNDVLGVVGKNGQSLERRINDILTLCRTPEEINRAFDELQNELQEQIAALRAATCKAVVENLDDDVRSLLKINQADAQDYLSEGEIRFMAITRNVLASRAVFSEDGRSFELVDSPLPEVLPGLYSYCRVAGDDAGYIYRPNSPLGEWVLDKAKQQDTPYAVVTFNLDSYEGKITMIERLRGKSGLLRLDLLTLKSLDEQSHLLFSAMTDDGQFLEPDIAEKLFKYLASEVYAQSTDSNAMSRLEENAAQYAKATVNKVGESNNEHFKKATEKLQQWSEDQIAAASHKVETLRARRRELERSIRQARNLDEQKVYQTEFDQVRREIRRARANIEAVEDETDEKRRRLLDDLQRRLIPEAARENLFAIRWRVI